jgi:phenylalanine-4-hydroxylase
LDDVAEFTQKIGLASLMATDKEIEELARLYWYSVEFGLTLENGDLKVFGAGLLSSPDEMEYAVTDEPHHPLVSQKENILFCKNVFSLSLEYSQRQNSTIRRSRAHILSSRSAIFN